MPRVRHDADGMVYACPQCDRAGDIYRRTGNGNAYVGDASAEFVCRDCKATFASPEERESREFVHGQRADQAGKQGLGRVMAELSVEEFDAIVHGERDAA